MLRQDVQPDQPKAVSPQPAHEPAITGQPPAGDHGISRSPAKHHGKTNPHFMTSTTPDVPSTLQTQHQQKPAIKRRARALWLLCWPSGSASVQQPQGVEYLEELKQQDQDGRAVTSQALQLHRVSKTEVTISVLCSIFWTVVLLLGVTILILYAIFNPMSPRFGVSSASLNLFRLDKNNMLYANLTLTANFTNPNKKASAGLKYIVVELYFGRTLLATQSIEPFVVPKAQTRTRELHMVADQVQLYKLEIARLESRASNRTVALDVKGTFLAHSRLLGNSFWLHGLCTVRLGRPPHGVLVSSHCSSRQ